MMNVTHNSVSAVFQGQKNTQRSGHRVCRWRHSVCTVWCNDCEKSDCLHRPCQSSHQQRPRTKWGGFVILSYFLPQKIKSFRNLLVLVLDPWKSPSWKIRHFNQLSVIKGPISSNSREFTVMFERRTQTQTTADTIKSGLDWGKRGKQSTHKEGENLTTTESKTLNEKKSLTWRRKKQSNLNFFSKSSLLILLRFPHSASLVCW